MEEQDSLNRIYSYLFYAAAVLALICGAFLSNAYLLVLTAALLLLSAIWLNSGHMLNSLLLRRSAVVEIYNGYRISEGLESIVKRIGIGYRAWSIARLKVDRRSSCTGEAVRALIEGIREPFEYSIILGEADRARILEGLETRRRMKEITLSRIDQKKQDRINALRREIDIVAAEIESVVRSGKALEVVMVIRSYADSESRSGAAGESARRIRHVADAFSAGLGLEYEVLSGERLLGFVEMYS